MKYPDLLTIATIHATILSIIAAAVGISVSLINSKKLEIMDRAFSDLITIQRLFPVGNPRFVPTDPNYNTDDDVVRTTVLRELPKVAFGPPLICDPGTKCVTAEELGEKAFLNLISLAHHYPFSNKYEYRPDGIFPGKDSVLRGEKVGDYMQWYEDTKSALANIVYIWETPGNSLLNNIEAYQTKLGEPKENPRNAFIEEYRKGLEAVESELAAVRPSDDLKRQKLVQHRNTLRRQFEELKREGSSRYKRDMASDILEMFAEAQKKLEAFTSFSALKRYEQIINPGVRATLFISLFITLSFGVVLPIFHPILQLGDFYIYLLHVLLPVFGHLVNAYCAYNLNSY